MELTPLWSVGKLLLLHDLYAHCRPNITRMLGSTTSDRIISESRYNEVFYYVTRASLF